MDKNTIYYSWKLIDDVKKLSSNLAESTDKNMILSRELWYLSPGAHIARIKKNVLQIPEIKRVISKESKILEIGSGIGTCCIIMKSITGAEVVGVEPAPKSYEKLHDCIRDFKECNQHLNYIDLNVSGEEIPYEKECFDFIYSFEVLEHVQDPQKVLREIYRLLKKGGCAYIATCNYDSFYEGHYQKFWNPYVSVERNRQRYINKGLSPQFLNEVNFITKRKIKKWVNEIGYSDIKFNPRTEQKNDSNRINLVYPDDYKLPNVDEGKPYWLHSFIEKERVSDFLSKFDRDYKLYFLLVK